jgi:hypothetical protein
MALAHYSAWKILWIASNAAIVAVFALDPNTLTGVAALIAALVGAGNLWLMVLTRQDNREIKGVMKEVKHNTDGVLASEKARAEQATARSNEQSIKLEEASQRADRAEGHREGSDEERARDKP